MRLIDADALDILGFREDFPVCECDTGWNAAVRMINDYVKAAPTIEAEPVKWISVSERLPKYDSKVLVADVRDGYISISELKAGGKVLADCWECVVTLSRLPVSEITHWMPLPQPPKEDAE